MECIICHTNIEELGYDGRQWDNILLCNDCYNNAMDNFVFQQENIFKLWLKEWVKL
jgi:hypothetical protein